MLRILLTDSLGTVGFNWWEAWGPAYLGGTGRLQQLYVQNRKAKTSKQQNAFGSLFHFRPI